MKKLAPLSLGLLLLLPGCFDVEADLVIEKDLSGTAGMSVTVDMESMVYVMATMQRAFMGEEGPPTEEELEAVRQELLADMQAEEALSEEEMWEEAERELPEGFELRELNFEREGLKTSMRFLVDYPHIERLNELRLDEPGRKEEEAMPGEPSAEEFDSLSEPFADIRFVDEGDTYLLESGTPNPVEDARESSSGMEGFEEMLGQAFKNLRVAMTIQVPGEIVEHNATRVEGNKLIWEFSFETLRETSGADLEHIMVRFRK